ncbi:FtsX-like permease family protein [Jeotgalibacillus terrae]|uniref:FtsX-like permease family protein n=1 Tax=Jeotgalibacillus terrae TaxID=587735 RepID=A0ABW5ZM34_9BACL|nr:FtsX-like permease family protein [Jeotgalibacillus terrae]MBM7578210.1 putative ABC transport system permease protein [Jeotgalibacillus terrae]
MLNTWLISWRNITTNRKRFFFTLFAIMLGVSFVTAMLVSERTTDQVFDYYEQMYVANADYWILSDEHTYPEEMLTTLQENPDVNEQLLVLDKQTFLSVEGDQSLSQRSVRITGVSDQRSPLLELPVIDGSLDNEGIVLPEAAADLLGKEVGDTIVFSGLGEAKISAIVEYTQILASPGDWERAESMGFRVMMPLNTLREWTGIEDEISYMRFQTEGEGIELFQSLQNEFQDSSVYIQPVVADDLQSNDIGGLYTFFYLIAGLSMFISGFIVFNMIYTSVIERKKEFAIMKSLGYVQSAVSGFILIEVALLALIGTVFGVPFGVLLGDVFMKALLGVFEFDMVYTLDWKIPVLISVFIGLLFPVLFSLFPIYHAGKTSILLALKGEQRETASKYLVWRSSVGAVLLALGFIDHAAAYFTIVIGIILLFPLLLMGISTVLKPVLTALFHHPGTLAAKYLTQQLNRNANTAAILAVGIAVIMMLGAVVQSAPAGYDEEIRSTYGGDVRVTFEAPWTEEDRNTILQYDIISAAEPITEATPITWETRKGVSRQFSVISVSENGPELFEAEGDEYAKLSEGPTVVLGSRAFEEWGGEIGQTIEMNSPMGKRDFEVADVVATSHYSGYVAFMDESHLQRHFGWSNSFDLLLTVTDGEAGALREQLWSDFGDNLSKVQTVEEEIQSVVSAITGMNELLMVMLILVIGLASIGTGNTLLMNTLERTKEIGTMRAVGFTKSQVRKMILAEGLMIGLAGIVGGVTCGVLLIYIMSQSVIMGGFLSFQFPVSHVVLSIVAGITLSLLAAWVSSESATKMELQSSLREG